MLKNLQKYYFNIGLSGLLGIIIGVVLYLYLANAEIIHTWEGVMYVSDSTITFAWDPSAGATYYKVEALWIDPKSGPVVFDLGTTTETQMVINRPKVGHFYLRVKACNDENECSPWSESIDASKTQIGKPFRVYFKLPPVGDITIE